jgi:hypothetical protein
MRYLLAIILLASSAAYGQSVNLSMPQAPQSFQSDRIRAGDLECSAAIGSSTNVEFGVVGLLNQEDPVYALAAQDPNYRYNTDQFMRDVGVYARINIPIGAPRQRLNCNTLYQLELQKKRLEVMKLEAEINNLRRLQFQSVYQQQEGTDGNTN